MTLRPTGCARALYLCKSHHLLSSAYLEIKRGVAFTYRNGRLIRTKPTCSLKALKKQVPYLTYQSYLKTQSCMSLLFRICTQRYTISSPHYTSRSQRSFEHTGRMERSLFRSVDVCPLTATQGAVWSVDRIIMLVDQDVSMFSSSADSPTSQ